MPFLRLRDVALSNLENVELPLLTGILFQVLVNNNTGLYDYLSFEGLLERANHPETRWLPLP